MFLKAIKAILIFNIFLFSIEGVSVFAASSVVLKANKKVIFFNNSNGFKLHQKVSVYRGSTAIAYGEIIKIKGTKAYAAIAFTKKNYTVSARDRVTKTNKTIRSLKIEKAAPLPKGRFSIMAGGPLQFSLGVGAERFYKKNHLYGVSAHLINQEVDKVKNTGSAFSAQYMYCKTTCFDNSFYLSGKLGFMMLNSLFTNVNGVEDFELVQSPTYMKALIGYQFKKNHLLYSIDLGLTQVHGEETIEYENKDIPNPLSDKFLTGQFTLSYVY